MTRCVHSCRIERHAENGKKKKMVSSSFLGSRDSPSPSHRLLRSVYLIIIIIFPPDIPTYTNTLIKVILFVHDDDDHRPPPTPLTLCSIIFFYYPLTRAHSSNRPKLVLTLLVLPPYMPSVKEKRLKNRNKKLKRCRYIRPCHVSMMCLLHAAGWLWNTRFLLLLLFLILI